MAVTKMSKAVNNQTLNEDSINSRPAAWRRSSQAHFPPAHMGHLVPGEALEIIWPEPCPISHLDPIRPALRQGTKEFVQISDKIPTVLVIGGPEPGKLEHH